MTGAEANAGRCGHSASTLPRADLDDLDERLARTGSADQRDRCGGEGKDHERNNSRQP